MSIKSLKLDLECRSGRGLLPSSFPIELLIKLTRELSFVSHRSLTCDELSEITEIMNSYMRRLIEMQCAELLKVFDAKVELFPLLAHELYECLQEEIVSRLICGNVSFITMRDRFVAVFEDEPKPI